MFSDQIKDPANVFCDHASIMVNSKMSRSTLKQKQNAIAYHCVQEAAVAGTI